MANQFEGMYLATNTTLWVELQEEYGTYKVVDPHNADLFWGGFKTISNARRYARFTLGAVAVGFIPGTLAGTIQEVGHA